MKLKKMINEQTSVKFPLLLAFSPKIMGSIYKIVNNMNEYK